MDESSNQSLGRIPPSLVPLLGLRDGPARVVAELQRMFPPDVIAESVQAHEQWEACGTFYLTRGLPNQSLPIFHALYHQMLDGQQVVKHQVHKGMPLIWLSECHFRLQHAVLGKRYAMLATCEDAIRGKGVIDPENTGTYFRLVWHYGMPHAELARYATEMWAKWQSHPDEATYPEWLLQEIDHLWMVEYPSLSEASLYSANPKYIQWLMAKMGSDNGESLERLAAYILSCVPGCRTYGRVRTGSTDYDVVCAVDGIELDFRSDLGRYFVCECKDWKKPADFSVLAKFCRVLDSTKSRFGILFSQKGITGSGRTTDSEREQLKMFQDRGVVVVVVSEPDLDRIAAGGNLIAMLREKYEKVRLDLRKELTAGTSEAKRPARRRARGRRNT